MRFTRLRPQGNPSSPTNATRSREPVTQPIRARRLKRCRLQMSKAGIALGSALLIVTGCQTQAANPQPDPEPAGERLQLRTDGIGLVDFGDPFEESARILRDRWGPELSSEERICDSGASLQILFWDGVMLVYYPEGLAGYLVGPPTDTPATQAAKDINTARTLG